MALSCLLVAAGLPALADEAGLTVEMFTGPATTLTISEIEALPTTQIVPVFHTHDGTNQTAFDGPLLWAVLVRAGAVDASKPREHVRQLVRVTGADGYVAVLALGEIDPEFEGKQVILATRMDAKELGAGHLRVVVAGDKRGGRSVHDVVGIKLDR